MIAILLTPLLLSQAQAYNLEGFAWSLDQSPVEIHWTGTLDGFTHDQLQSIVEGAADAWTAVAPCTFAFDVVEDADADAWFSAGGDVAVVFGGDTSADSPWIQESASTAGTGFGSFGPAPRVELQIGSSDLWWVPDAGCDQQTSLQAILTHELGHILGLRHSCEENETCTSDEADATMFWSTAACDDSTESPNTDDIAGLDAIYDGGMLPFGCTADPTDWMTVRCAATTDADIAALSPTWDFGDGATGAGASATHTYATVDIYDVTFCVEPATCGEPLCDTVRFQSNSAAYGSADTTDAPASKGCASAPGGASFLGALLSLGLAGRRRRPCAALRPYPPPNDAGP